MKVVLVNPRRLTTPNHPLGLLYIAGALEKKGHTVKVIDPSVTEKDEKIVEGILREKPDAVGFTVTTPQITRGISLGRVLREKSTVPIIFGGVHTTVLPEEVLSKDFVNYVVVGEGEKTIEELIDSIEGKIDLKDVNGIGYKENRDLKFTDPRPLIENLDEINFPARYLLPSKWYFAPPRMRGVWTESTATVIASRGCPYKCIYCASHLLFGRKVRYRSVQNVIQELKELREGFNIDAVWFADDTFTLNSEWVNEFCGRLQDEKWRNFRWGVQARVDTVDSRILKNMKEAGCIQLDFGVETGSEKVWKILKKSIRKEQVVRAFKIAKSVGLQRFASFMVGTPGETEEDIMKTQNLIREIKPDYSEFFYATPYPGTDLYEIAVKHEQIDTNMPFDQWICSKQEDKPVLCMGFSKEELIRYRSMLHNHVVLRNYLTMLKNPSFVAGSSQILLKGIGGLTQGIKRFLMTGKIDTVFVEILHNYREKLKKQKV
jgi:anaerobic magnesium-protoporphyrin IX monomethyl ester cyclase